MPAFASDAISCRCLKQRSLGYLIARLPVACSSEQDPSRAASARSAPLTPPARLARVGTAPPTFDRQSSPETRTCPSGSAERTTRAPAPISVSGPCPDGIPRCGPTQKTFRRQERDPRARHSIEAARGRPPAGAPTSSIAKQIGHCAERGSVERCGRAPSGTSRSSPLREARRTP